MYRTFKQAYIPLAILFTVTLYACSASHKNTVKPSTFIAKQEKTSRKELKESTHRKIRRLDVHRHPEKFISIRYHQDPNGPLLVRFENNSPFDITKLTLYSQLLNAQDEVVMQETWHTKETINAHKRSRFYLSPVSYHLQQGEKIKTQIKDLII
mgnify:FL=1